DLGQRVLPEAADELRADLVTGREEEEVEEDDLGDRIHLDVELPDQDAREKRPDDVADLESADLDASEKEADGERQEDRELRVVPKGLRQVRQHSTSSARHEEEPWSSDEEKDQDVEHGRDRAELVELPLRQVSAPDDEEVRARGLRSDRREIAGREEEGVADHRKRHAEVPADAEEDAEKGEHVRGLADEEVVEEDVGEDEDDVRRDPRKAAKSRAELLAEVSHESQRVQLAAKRIEDREPDEGRQHVAGLPDVLQRQDAGGQQDSEAQEGHRRQVDFQRARQSPENDHDDECR